MPLDAQHAWRREEMVAGEEILAQLRSVFTLSPIHGSAARHRRETWLVDGYTNSVGQPARVGVIASVTQPFCGACDRTRLTADGQVRNCLFGQEETDLRGLLRSGADRRRDRRRLAGGDVGQAGRARHRRPVVPAAGPSDDRHRRLSRGQAQLPTRIGLAARTARACSRLTLSAYQGSGSSRSGRSTCSRQVRSRSGMRSSSSIASADRVRRYQ